MSEEKICHILLIEDNPGDVRLIKEYLKEPSIQFQPTIDVEENLKGGSNRLQEKAYDVVLLDLSLPDSFGLATFEKVSSVSGPVPVIVLTGLDDERLGIEAVHLGAQDFLIKKEINAQLLERSILYAIQRNRLSQQLRESERRYRMLFQSTSDEILVFQVDEKMNPLPFMEVNSVACEILNYSRGELLQKTIYDIDSAGKKEIDKRIEHILMDKEVTQESRYQTRDGNIIPVEISARSFYYNGRNTIISIGRDIRERRKLEEEILKISDQERQRIGRDMHDSLGQMLTGIGLITQNLAKKLKANELYGADEVQEISDMIKEADEQARSLSRGLVPVNVESNGLNTALQELAAKTSRIYNIDVNFKESQISLIENNITAIHLYRITQETINNAVKHGQATTINIKLSTMGNHVTLSIEDNGSGFLERESMSDGMGLRIMNFRMQIIGGHLEINSEQGKGTVITCQIPKEGKI